MRRKGPPAACDDRWRWTARPGLAGRAIPAGNLAALRAKAEAAARGYSLLSWAGATWEMEVAQALAQSPQESAYLYRY
jgi:hypothetical protein